jgi:hypothetical protein
MARVQSPPVLAQIRVARNYSEQATSLRALKDEVIGHVQRKERWIEYGILETLVKILHNNLRASTTLNGKEPRSQPGQPRPLSEDEEVRLLSLQLLVSFAYGELAVMNARGRTLMQPRRPCVPRSPPCCRCGPSHPVQPFSARQPSAARIDGLAGLE